MDNNYDDRNKTQIIRIDVRNCFVESKSDSFEIGKVHLEFAAYDTSKPTGQRQTNNIHIYINVPEFLCLAQEALSGILHGRARQQRASNDKMPMYQSLGGTSADKLKQYNRPRPDGKSLSRTVQLILGKKEDSYLFIADSGPSEADSKGLIVPKFGSNPENHVAVSMSWRAVNELMVMTKTHYEAWLSAKYVTENGDKKIQANNQPQATPKAVSKTDPPPQNRINDKISDEINDADIRMF